MTGRVTPLGYAARVSVGGEVVAESSGALRCDDPEQGASLWFPRADVGAAVAGGLPVLAAPDDVPALAGYVAFDPATTTVEVLDETVLRWPTWGDAADLVAVMDVMPADDGSWTSVARAAPDRPVVEGSQMLGQAIVAASRLLPERRVTSAHMVFVRPADARRPLRFVLDEVSAGRSFGSFAVRVEDGGRTCAAGTLLLGAPADDAITHGEPMPDVPGPTASSPYDMGVTGRDLRVVDGAYTGDPDAPVGPPELDAWVRFRSVPDDPALHVGLLAQFTGHLSIAAALRAHAGVGESQAHHTLSTAVNAIALSVHTDVRVDQWLLYHHRSTRAVDGMTHSECRAYQEDGTLVASFTVDCMVRPFSGGAVGDRKTSM
ncbi:MAG: thioesterase family protein [Acidimicrobiia bacterium]